MEELLIKHFDQTLEEGTNMKVPIECLDIYVPNVSRRSVKEALKERRLYKYYEYIPAIVDHLNGITSSPMTDETKQIIRNEYVKYLLLRDKSKPRTPTHHLIYCMAINPNIMLTDQQREFLIRRFPCNPKYKDRISY